MIKYRNLLTLRAGLITFNFQKKKKKCYMKKPMPEASPRSKYDI